jgi:hypothetical protein
MLCPADAFVPQRHDKPKGNSRAGNRIFARPPHESTAPCGGRRSRAVLAPIMFWIIAEVDRAL